MLRVERSRAGEPTATVGTRALVSRYAPRREAARFVQEQLADRTPATVIVLGEVLGYLTEAIQAVRPDTTVIAVYYSSDTLEHRVAQPSSLWHPRASLPFQRFLEINLPEHCLSDLEAIEWVPAADVFADVAQQIREQLRRVIQRMSAGAVTATYFGRRWFRNAVANYLHLSHYTKLSVRAATIVIAASGPSLSEYLPELRAKRRDVMLWALPSAVLPLAELGLAPDLVVLTDGGVYAVEHLQPLRYSATPVVMPLIAGRGVWRLKTPVAPFCQGGVIEDGFAVLLGPPAARVPPNGTVAGSALDLALQCKPRAVAFVGLDLCTRDIALHARPHAFEHYFERTVTRLHPYLTKQFEAAEPYERIAAYTRRSPALETYAGWFSERLRECPLPVYRVPPSPVEITGMAPSAHIIPDSGTERPSLQQRLYAAPGLSERKRRAGRLIASFTAAAARLAELAPALHNRQQYAAADIAGDPDIGSLKGIADPELKRAADLTHYLTPKLFRNALTAETEHDCRRVLQRAQIEITEELHKVQGWTR